MYTERREKIRVPVERDILHFIQDRPFRSSLLNVSASGIYVHKPFEPFSRKTRLVQIEIPIPEVSEIVWAKGEIVFDKLYPPFHYMGIRFAGMADFHARLIADFSEEVRQAILKRMLREIKLKRELSLALPKIQAPPPVPRFERTLVGYAPIRPSKGLVV